MGDTFCKPEGQENGSSVNNRTGKSEGACGFLIRDVRVQETVIGRAPKVCSVW